MEHKIRNPEIDSLRGLAVLLMVMVHSAATWDPYNTTQTSLLAYFVAGLGGLAAPLFVTIFGWGLIKSTSSYKSNIIKASILFSLQIIVNISSPHLYETFTPGVLSLFAILILLKPLIIYFCKSKSNLLFYLVLFSSIYTIEYFYLNLQGTNDWDSRISIEGPLQMLYHLILTGTYPLFPWITFAIIGAFIGTNISRKERTMPRDKTTTLLILFGILFCLSTLLLSITQDRVWAHPTKGYYLNFFPANIGFITAATTGIFLLWLLIQEFKIHIFSDVGKVSLTVYVVHFIPLTIMSNFEEKYNWAITESSLAVLFYTSSWLLFSYILKKHQYLTIENLIRKFTKP